MCSRPRNVDIKTKIQRIFTLAIHTAEVSFSYMNRYHTPNMERMAEQGICFSTFYAQSVSSPSRASLLTGQNATRHRTTNWINAESNNRTPFGPPDWNWKGLTKDIPTMPKVLQQAGYKTISNKKDAFLPQL